MSEMEWLTKVCIVIIGNWMAAPTTNSDRLPICLTENSK